MPEDFLGNFAQFFGQESFFTPSVLIPQPKINQFLQGYLNEVKRLEQAFLDFGEQWCKVTFMVVFLIKFSVNFDITSEGIAFADNMLSVKLKRLTKIRFSGKNMIITGFLNIFYFLFEKILRVDLLNIVSRGHQNLAISGQNILIKIKLSELSLTEKEGKWLKLIGDTIQPEFIQFVKNGVRLTFSVHNSGARN